MSWCWRPADPGSSSHPGHRQEARQCCELCWGSDSVGGGLAAGLSWQVSPGSFPKIPVLPARIQPCWGSFSSPSVPGGMVLGRAGRGKSRDARAFQGVIPRWGDRVHPRPATLGGDEGTGACSSAQGLPPVPRGGSARGRGTERRNDALPTPHPPPPPPHLRGWGGLESPEPRSPDPAAVSPWPPQKEREPLGFSGSGRVSDRSSTWRREEQP